MSRLWRIRMSAVAVIIAAGANDARAELFRAQVTGDCWQDGDHIYCDIPTTECNIMTGAGICEAVGAVTNYLYGTNWIADGVWCGDISTTCSFHSGS